MAPVFGILGRRETILTGLLVFTVFAATDGARARITSHLPILAPLAIGFAVFVAHLVGGHLVDPLRLDARSVCHCCCVVCCP